MVNPEGFPSFPQPERGGKGGGDFLFKAALAAALWLPLSPLAARRAAPSSPPQRSFSFCFFFFYLRYVYYLYYIYYVDYLSCWRYFYG